MVALRSELTVIVKAKDLCSYVLTVTEKSPKRFRFTLVAKLQGYALGTIENLYRANEVYVKVVRNATGYKLTGYGLLSCSVFLCVNSIKSMVQKAIF